MSPVPRDVSHQPPDGYATLAVRRAIPDYSNLIKCIVAIRAIRMKRTSLIYSLVYVL